MTAIKPADADAFVRKPDPARPIILVYGPDGGLAHERAQSLAHGAVDDPSDAFSLIRMDGDELSGAPFRLVEEANTMPMFGGRRAIWLRAGSRNIAAAVEALLAAPAPDCRVVIEAGDLKKTSPLRAICEKAKNAATIGCYADDERGIARVIDEELKAASLTIAADARAALMPFLGGDRQATRAELRKLALYALGRGSIGVDDVMAVVADASAVALDNVLDAAFAGKPADMEAQFAKARGEGIAAGALVSAAIRHTAALHRMRIAVDEGAAASEAVKAARPPIHFRRTPRIEAALRDWSAARLLEAMAFLADASLQTRRHADLAEAIARDALMTLSRDARRRAGTTASPR